MIDDNWRDRLMEAREIHRAGRLDVARAVYETLLNASPEDTEVRGLLGVLALQEGRMGDSEALLRQAVLDGGDARIHLRNLNNLLALLKQTGDSEAARELVAGDLPAWPEDAVPDASERQTVLSLCWALLLLGRAESAHQFLGQAIPEQGDDAEALGLTGRALLALGETSAAAEKLERAAQLVPSDGPTLIALSYAQDQLGQAKAARETVVRIARISPVFALGPKPSQRATVMLLTPAPRQVSNVKGGLSALHFSANLAAQFAMAMGDEFQFLSVFADLPSGSLPRTLPKPDVILNNCVDPETMNVPGRLDLALEVIERSGAPVINHPRAVFATTRQKVADLLQGIPNLRIPRIARYRLDSTPTAEIAADIENEFAYPVILRRCQAHTSARLQHTADKGVVVLVEDGAALRSHLGTVIWPEIYAIEYVQLPRKFGQFRKIRAVLAEDETIVAIPGYGSTWMVGGGPGNPNWVAYYRKYPEFIADCRKIVLDPERYLGADCMRVLDAVRDRMPLDLFGVDFELDEAGQVVLFEANAAMNILKRPNEPEDQTLPDAPFDRIEAAFRRAVDRRIVGAT